MKATIKSTGKVVEVVSRFMPKKKTEPSRDWVCNLSDGTCIDEKELEYAPDTSATDTSATISSILNEFGRKVAGKCYGMSPVSDSCGIVVNKVNTEEYINRIVGAVREQMLKDAVEVKVDTTPLHGPVGITIYCSNFPNHPFYKCKPGDKVKIIIL